MMNALNLSVSVLLTSSILLAGCVSEPMGRAKSAMVQAQTLDPDAGTQMVTTPYPVAGREIQAAIATPGKAADGNKQSSKSITLLMGN